MNQYLIPANSKSKQLIAGIFRPIDLIILLVGAFISLLLMLILNDDTLGTILVKLFPVGISVLLILPVPYYHNILVFIREWVMYLMSIKRYYWRGWCASHEFGDKK